MRYQVRVLRRARKDLAEIQRYFISDREAATVDVVALLLEAIESLSELPARGSLPRDERLRRLGYRYLLRGAYLVFYKIFKSQVRAYRVVHGRRDYPTWL